MTEQKSNADTQPKAPSNKTAEKVASRAVKHAVDVHEEREAHRVFEHRPLGHTIENAAFAMVEGTVPTEIPEDFDHRAPCPICGAQYERHVPPSNDEISRLGVYGALLNHVASAHTNLSPTTTSQSGSVAAEPK